MQIKKKKKVLILTSDFPPVGGVKVFRWLKFVKYLPQYGWEPIVITTRISRSMYFDHSLLEEVPERTKVIRTYFPDPPNTLIYRAIRAVVRKVRRKEARPSNNEQPVVLSRGLFLKISSWLLLPDSYILWLPIALLKALLVIKREEIDVVLTTLPQFSCGIIGYLMKKITGLPWVVDIRDPWSKEPLLICPTALHRLIHEKMEKLVLKNADKIIVVSEPLKEKFKEQNGIEERKFKVIPNGFDPEDFEKIGPARRDAEFIMTFTGSFEKNRTPEFFLRGLSELLSERNDMRGKIKVNFIGWSGNLRPLIDKYGLDDVVFVYGFRSHRESLEFMMASDVLLIFITPEEFQKTLLTTKVYEYLYARKFILASAPLGGALDNLLRETGGGITIDSQDWLGMKKAIADLYDRKITKGLSVPDTSGLTDRFDRKSLTKVLSEYLDGLYAKNN